MQTIKIKPLSVNQAWQGKRYKTKDYKIYEKSLLLLLKQQKVPPGRLKLTIEAGLSNKCQDVDNILKPFIDVLQKKHHFNDREIFEINVKKQIVKRGQEFITYLIEQL